ncbi:MAG: gliding motility protein RemB [Flavobacteriaceae bacterium]|nr:gliding motility protein RemB [Flavobacteriaceae bacterium]
MKYSIFVVFSIMHLCGYSQDFLDYEKPPVFPNCDTEIVSDLKNCFLNELSQFISTNFVVPNNVDENNYKGEVVVLFEVNAQGRFVVIYIDAFYDELKEEVKRVFALLPSIKPATYNGITTFKQYSYHIQIPLINSTNQLIQKTQQESSNLYEFESINTAALTYQNKEFSSQLNIPFTHQGYAKFDRHLNMIGLNSHTAAKPYIYQDVARYYDLKQVNLQTYKEGTSWWSKKLFNEHLVQVQGDDYWFTFDPIFDLQAGKDNAADFSTTFNNTRGVYIQGGLGKQFSFSTSFYESQGRFAHYINNYAESLRAFGPDPAIIPGRGIGKRFKKDAYDYPVAEAYLSYTPNKFINIQFGHGKNFIGDGYRSLLQSDVSSPSTFLKLNTKFWKIKYTNTWMWLRDVRPEVVQDKAFLTKYMANHYLSWNVSKRFNLGLFESVMWTNSNDRGFDVNYLNPLIFFRALEFETGQGAGNALVGLSGKYKLSNNANIYSQFILDEFSLNDITGGKKSWKNKYGYQIGLKYFNAFKIDNLLFQMEYNRVRPYTYSHNTIVLNYAHDNQSMAHLWGSNFSETILIGRYHYNRWFADAKIVFGKKGFDFNDDVDDFSYGGDIYRNYNERPFDSGVTVGQGNTTNIFHFELQSGYVLNPTTNLKLFAYVSYRDFNPDADTAVSFKNSTLWFSLGLRTDLFNWYFDF